MNQANTRKHLAGQLTLLRSYAANLKDPASRTEYAEDEFSRFFAQSLDLLCIAGFDGYFKRLNPAWETRLGWTLAELTARPFLDFVHPDDREATQREVGRLSEGAVTILFENRYRHRNGSYRWLRWTANPVPGRRRIYATARDVTEQKRLEREILDIADREKERLGRELHDGLCQTLAGIAALSSTLSRRLASSAEPAGSAAAAEISKLLSETIQQARDLAHGLGPVGLNEAGLNGELETLALNVQHLFRVSCTLEWRPVPGLSLEVEGHLFRIAQEALNNAVSHGRADRVEMRMRSRDGTGILSVRDDGVGVAENEHKPGFGLRMMAYRARLIGGSLKVRRCTPRGTSVTCVFPLPATPETKENPDHAHSQA